MKKKRMITYVIHGETVVEQSVYVILTYTSTYFILRFGLLTYNLDRQIKHPFAWSYCGPECSAQNLGQGWGGGSPACWLRDSKCDPIKVVIEQQQWKRNTQGALPATPSQQGYCPLWVLLQRTTQQVLVRPGCPWLVHCLPWNGQGHGDLTQRGRLTTLLVVAN